MVLILAGARLSTIGNSLLFDGVARVGIFPEGLDQRRFAELCLSQEQDVVYFGCDIRHHFWFFSRRRVYPNEQGIRCILRGH